MVDNTVKTIEERLNERDNKPENDKKNKKGIIVAIVASVLAIAAAITGLLLLKKNNKQNAATTKTTSIEDENKDNNSLTTDLSGLGVELELPSKENENKQRYGASVNGIADLDKIVSTTDSKTGKTTIYKDEEALKNSENIGSVIDTKGGSLIVENGKVKEKTPGYEYTDPDTGKTVTGNGNVPSGYTEVAPGEYIKEDDLKDMVEITSTIYNSEGVLYNAGEYVTKEGYDKVLEYIQKGILSYQPIVNPVVEVISEEKPVIEESKPVEETKKAEEVEEGVINKDGTYTIYGLTFETKADYEQWIIQGYEGYDLVDGIMMSTEARLAYEKTLNR